ncbi:hypothetical protein [Pseudomonas chlororaphis]|uniref:hypothetical protein n=1 Tax=Pseudomonas chlororaphis TaxID=587753 RepID=UPI000F58C9B1|nr:hypothetical protein [Pseudomonas chlororaphis]AZC83985.1 hypothetical protein C4K30_4893 [Pseudomonas chlororaphis subsp. piscium]
MPNKELRIAIADESLPRLIQIEKSLNRLGYYRILPIQFCEDLWMLSNAFDITFDVLIANRTLALDTESDLVAFCQTTNKINHTLLYGSQQSKLTTISFSSSKMSIICSINIPSEEFIAGFMNSIDPPLPWVCLKGIAWIKSVPEPNQNSHNSEHNDTQTFIKLPN